MDKASVMSPVYFRRPETKPAGQFTPPPSWMHLVMPGKYGQRDRDESRAVWVGSNDCLSETMYLQTN